MASDSPNPAYSNLLLQLCEGLSVRSREVSAEQIALVCPACGIEHVRAAETVIAFATAYRLSGDAAWFERARRLGAWAIAQQAQDGSWTEDPNDPWNGISIFILLTLAAAYDLIGDRLAPTQQTEWQRAIALGAEWAVGIRPVSHLGQAAAAIACKLRLPGSAGTGQTAQYWNTSYIASLPLTLLLCGRILDRDYRAHEKRFVDHVVALIEADGLLGGEVNEPAPKWIKPWTKFFRRTDAIDPGYNLDTSLGVLALYARQTDDAMLLARVAASAQAHLCLLYPDGSVDNGMGARGYKASWYGSQTAHGLQIMAAGLSAVDAQFSRAGELNARLLERCMDHGLLQRGPFGSNGSTAPCLYASFSRAVNLSLALMDLPPTRSPLSNTPLPCEMQPAGLWRLPALNCLVVRQGRVMITVSGQRRDSSRLPYRLIAPATGGTLTRFHHDIFGPIQAAGPAVYQRIEPVHMPEYAAGENSGARIESRDGKLSSAHDRRVRLRSLGGSTVEVRGRLRTRWPWRTGARFSLEYTAVNDGLQKIVRIPGKTAQRREFVLCEPLIATGDTVFAWVDEHTLEMRRQRARALVTIQPLSGQCAITLDQEPVTHYSPPLSTRTLRIRVHGEGDMALRLSFAIDDPARA